MQKKIYSVSDLVTDLRTLVEKNYPEIWVEGEISNFSAPPSGHCYFSLKEGNSTLRCAFFARLRQTCPQQPREGMQALLRGSISIYPARGDLQLIVSYLEEAGEGALRREFERLKAKLSAEGLFEQSHKLPLPSYPTAIGVITSAHGAALHDIRVTLQRRYPIARLIVYPTLVQGEAAPDNITEMLHTALNRREVDLLILARGGGSAEDLQAFNDERVARAVFAAKSQRIPIISAIGHETDFVITDWVADLRAPTPTAAAEKISPDRADLLADLRTQTTALARILQRAIDTRQQNLDHTRARLGKPRALLQHAHQTQRALTNKLHYLRTALFDRLRLRLHQQTAQLRYRAPQSAIALHQHRLKTLRTTLTTIITNRLRTAEQTRHNTHYRLDLMNPQNTLNRGYAILQDTNQKVITAAQTTTPAQTLTAKLARGKLQLTVAQILETEAKTETKTETKTESNTNTKANPK